jgi:radical SAM superfamily enzyme YgiQ (UPF0313 family)
MAKRVLLVYPKTPVTTYWSFRYALPFLGKKTMMPPLGLLTVAALLPEGYETRLVDLNVRDLQPEELQWCDLVFLSAMIVQRRSFEQVVRAAKSCGKTVVAGGPYPISAWQQIEGVDHFVLDEAELTLPAFLADLEAGRPRQLYRSSARADMEQTPPPRFDLVDTGSYESMAVQFSRGCPFECEFCDIIEMFGRQPRTKSPGQFLRELQLLYETGFRGSLFVVDDNFVGNRRRVKQLLPPLAQWQERNGYPFHLYTEASLDLAQDEELMELMVEAGFGMVFVGIETPDSEALALAHKRQNLRGDMLADVRRIQREGLEVAGGFIVGLDGEGEDIFERQLDFIQAAGIPMAMVGLLQPVPNTRLFRRLESEGRLLGSTQGNNTHDFHLDFVPLQPAERLLAGYKELLRRLYSPGNYFERCLGLLRELPLPPRRGGKVSMAEIRAFLLSLARQSFSAYGPRYLGYLMWALFRYTARFPLAVALAIKGYHFLRMTREILKADAFKTLLGTTYASLRSEAEEASERWGHAAVRTLEIRVALVLSSARRTYKRLERGVQQLVEEALADFELRCRRLLSGSEPVYD